MYEEDVIQTEAGDLTITFLGHASLAFAYQGKAVYVDPVGNPSGPPVDYSKMPKADIILVTHEHFDHFDPKAVSVLRKEQTQIILTKACAGKVSGGTVMKNGDALTVQGIKIEAVPAYNIVQKFHPKGVGNGYILNFDKTRVYVAGDTENTPEMKQLKNIDIAFLPMNLPYTMTPKMVADAAKAFGPKILYPYHYGQTDPNKLVDLLKDSKTQVRVRKMK
ncbi:MAG: MBL fold metallo-hydrolase [Planctomycetes bacterium]|nr:MBL fold metallo-hydrolase [Planctomycetota bacterium]